METHTLPAWLPTANRIVKSLHRIGLPFGTIHVLTVPGRTSGAPRATPVSPLTVDGRRYVVAALPNADWARNARAAGRGELSRGRRRVPVAVHEVSDPDLCRRVVAAFPREVPHGVPFFVQLGLVQKGTPEEFAEIADRVAVFELVDDVQRRASSDLRRL